MARGYFPTRRKFERESISYQCGPIAATLANKAGDRSKFWLQVKNNANLRWSCRSSIFRTDTNVDEIANYLGMVAGMVNAIDELVVAQEEKENRLAQAMKNMASISFFNKM